MPVRSILDWTVSTAKSYDRPISVYPPYALIPGSAVEIQAELDLLVYRNGIYRLPL